MKGLSKGPLGLLERLERQAELKNVPRVGSHENPYFPAMQLNVANPIEESAQGSGARYETHDLLAPRSPAHLQRRI